MARVAKRKMVTLTDDWLMNWRPSRIEEVRDRGTKGLVVRGGPSGMKTFLYGHARERLGYFPETSLTAAREKVAARRERRAAEVPGALPTVKALAESYRDNVLRPNRDSADETYAIIENHVLATLGERVARDVKPPEVAAVVEAAKVRRVNGEGRRVGGPGTARVVLRECKSIFAHGVGKGHLQGSPAAALRARDFGIGATARRRWLKEPELRDLFTALDLNALLDGTAKPRRLSVTVRLALALLLYVPVRSHSLLGARWSEFDLDGARWTIPVARLKLKRKERAADLQPFTVPLPATALAILKRLKEKARGASPFVLTSPRPEKDGAPRAVEDKALARALKRLQADDRLSLNGSPVTPHDLRRTWRSWAMDLGVSDTVARLSLGHAGLEGVEGVYGRAQMVEQRAQAAELVGAAFDRIRLGSAATVVPLAERASGTAPAAPR